MMLLNKTYYNTYWKLSKTSSFSEVLDNPHVTIVHSNPVYRPMSLYDPTPPQKGFENLHAQHINLYIHIKYIHINLMNRLTIDSLPTPLKLLYICYILYFSVRPFPAMIAASQEHPYVNVLSTAYKSPPYLIPSLPPRGLSQ